MKKIILAVILVIICLLLAACGKKVSYGGTLGNNIVFDTNINVDERG